jgi:hypothetical protein
MASASAFCGRQIHLGGDLDSMAAGQWLRRLPHHIEMLIFKWKTAL